MEARPWWRRSLGWGLAILALLLLLAGALLVFLSETQAGRDWVARSLLPRVALESGLALEADWIEGSLVRRPVILGARLRDLDGVFMEAPRVEIDWRTRTFLAGAIRIERLEVPRARLLRLPRLNPTPPDEPILPDIRLAIDRLAMPVIEVDEAVAGAAERLAVSGRIDLREGRLLTDLDLNGQKGDRLQLLVDAEPDRDRFELGLRLDATGDGLFAGLAGIDRPLTARLSGDGSWARWQGSLGVASGDDRLAALALSARDGTFRIEGQLEPASFLDGTAAALAGPRVALEATASPGSTRATTAFTLALAGAGGLVEASGEVDRGKERFLNLEATATLTSPSLFDPRLTGTPLRVTASGNGPWRQPALDLGLGASRLAYGAEGAAPIAVEGLEATGQIRWGKEGEPRLPFEIRATRIAGIDAPIGPLLGNPRLSGELALLDARIAAESLTLAASGISATGSGEYLRASGRARLAADVSVPGLAAEGIGRGDLRIALSLDSSANGTLSAGGRARLVARALDNRSLADFLGGNPELDLPFAFDGRSGRISVSNGRLASPSVQLQGINGQLDPASGAFMLNAAGRLSTYGPIDVKASGTLAEPRATIRMQEPGLGIGLSSLVAEIAPEAGGFRILATGDTTEGPARLDGRVELAAGRPLALRILSAEVAGLQAQGRLEQQPGGAFAGRLMVDGAGIEGSLTFLEEGGHQRIDLEGVAAQARLPLSVPIRIGAGDLALSILFLPEGPRISGEARGRNIRRGSLEITDLVADGRSEGALAEGRIRLSGSAEGRPLRLAATVAADRDGYRIGLEGVIDNVPLRLERPARVRRIDGGFELLPARLAVSGGTVDLSGRLAERSRLRLKAGGVDVQFLRLVGLGPGLRGQIDADIDLTLGANDPFPEGRARLRLSDFAAQSILEGMPEVNLDAEIVSRPDGLDAGLAITGTRGTTGRMRVQLAPGPGDSLAARALSGALSGGIRYTGPAETVWSLLNVPDQSLVGAIGLAADFSGTLGAPELAGGFRGEQLLYRHLSYGTRISGLTIQGVFEGNEVRLVQLEGAVNGGTIKGSGSARLAAEGAGAVDIALELDRARIADSPSTRLTVSGPLRLSGSLRDSTLSGELRIDEGQIRLGALQSATAISDIPVRRRGAPVVVASTRPSRFGLDIRVTARDSVKVQGLGLDSFWGAQARLGGDLALPKVTGEARLARGTFDFAGRSFEIRRGLVGFAGEPLDSSLAIEATATSEGFTASVRIDGTARQPQLSFASIPPLPEDEVLARLLFGSSVADLSAPEALQLASAIGGLRGGTGGLDPLGRIQRISGIDRIRLTGSDSETGMGTGIAIGERIGRNLYVEVATDTSGNALTRVELTLTRVLSLLAHVTTLGDAGINLRYGREY